MASKTKQKDVLVERYCNSFYETVEELKALPSDQTDNTVKVFQAPMGFGKTHFVITDWIPYIFNETNTKNILLTAPLTDIVADNLIKLQIQGRKSGFLVTTDTGEARQYLKLGEKFVLYLTNQGAFVSEGAKKLFEKLKGPDTAIFNDEFHAWSTSDKSKLKEVMGGGSNTFQARMYKTLSDFAPSTNWLFAITATPNFEVKGIIPTYGDLNYEWVNEADRILPQQIANRSAWISESPFFSKNKLQIIEKALEEQEDIEDRTGFKRVMMIVCEQDRNPYNWGYENVEDFLLQRIDQEEDSYSIGVSTCKGVYKVNSHGSIKIDDQLLLESANDFKDPLKYILVVDKFRMGINCSPLKSIVILKESDRKRSDGSAVTENAVQVLGRAIRPNPGILIEDFYKYYDGNLDNIDFPKEMNEMSFYMYDTKMWRDAYDYFKNNLAPIQKHCPTCTCYD